MDRERGLRITGAYTSFEQAKPELKKQNPDVILLDIQLRVSAELMQSVFTKAINVLESDPGMLWSFAEHPRSLPPSELKGYWENYGYMDSWIRWL